MGLVIGAVAVLATRWSERSTAAADPFDPPLPRGVGDVLSVLKSIAVVLDASDRRGQHLGVRRRLRPRAPRLEGGHELRHIARQVRRDGLIREAGFDLPRGPNAQASTVMRVRVAPIAVSHVLILAEDHTRPAGSRRCDATSSPTSAPRGRRPPVGGISLLAEAVPTPVTTRMPSSASPSASSSSRLTGRLVKEIVDLAAPGRRHPARARHRRRSRRRRRGGGPGPRRRRGSRHPGARRRGGPARVR